MRKAWATITSVAVIVGVLVLGTAGEAEAQRGYARGRVRAGGYGRGYRGRGRVRARGYGRYRGRAYGRGYFRGYRRGYGRFYGRRYGGAYYGRGGYRLNTRVYGGYGPRVYVTGPVLAPPVVYAPAPVVLAGPPVAVVGPPPVQISANRPAFQSSWGLGVRGLFVGESASKSGGVGGHLRFRGSRWLGLEISADYLRVNVEKVSRHDVPVMAALLIYLTPGRLAPYLVAGAGVNFAKAYFANGLTDSAPQLAVQGGGGIELRLGSHLGLNADIRYIYRERLNNGEEVRGLQNIGREHGAQVLVGGTWYF